MADINKIDPDVEMLGKVQPQYDEFLRNIGAIAVNFAVIEDSVRRAICHCLGGCDLAPGLIVIEQQINYRTTVDLLSQLAPVRLPKQFSDRVETLVPILRSAGKERNFLIHSSATLILSHTGMFKLATLTRTKRRDPRRVTLRFLQSKLHEFQMTRNEIESLNSDMLRYFTEQDACTAHG